MAYENANSAWPDARSESSLAGGGLKDRPPRPAVQPPKPVRYAYV